MATKAFGSIMISEMKEFASFGPGTQRYVKRSIDIASGEDAAAAKWARDSLEAASINAQEVVYSRIPDVRRRIPKNCGLLEVEPIMSPLVVMAAFDLGQGRLPTFSSFRFLYERLIGARIRPWLPSVFLSAASLPHIEPDKRRDLLVSLSESVATAPGWSEREPRFMPTWVEREG